ncbi:CPBP family intramembrane metalloprotease [Halogeometricum borinquense]|uniref:CPBP family intramembrane metalloprotease n=1 Tax=Halogeometricum borinquense TaxID=60847 RepID=A0A6C0UM40_9EURY|nr:CPBP family intramembrane metalloprotease [Halogeometricum borinquense]QIQ77696.1 CPBP family intramembrane metalloprotease [Halogeometricum borinquense]
MQTVSSQVDASSPSSQLRALAVAILLAIAGPVLGLAFVFLVSVPLVLTGIEITPILNISISLVFLTWGGIGGMAFLYLRYRNEDLSYFGIHLPGLRDILAAGIGYVAALGLGYSSVILVSQLNVETGTNQAAQLGMENPEVLLLLIPASFLFIGVGEELLFRGVVQSRLRESFSPAVGILLASVIFAAIHFFAIGGTPMARLTSISILLLPSVVFGIVYEYTDNLLVPIFIHGAYDATIFFFLYLAVKLGNVPQESFLFF